MAMGIRSCMVVVGVISLVDLARADSPPKINDAIKQANWGPYTEWFLRDQQAPIAVRKVYEELDGKLK